MKLLVVDDSSVARKIIKAAADVLRLETVEAEDGNEALSLLSQIYKETCLILLDRNMPEKDGYDVLVEIKNNGKYKHIPVMMVTTEGEKKNIIDALKAGASNYLTKPFSVDELQSKIIECIGEEALSNG